MALIVNKRLLKSSQSPGQSGFSVSQLYQAVNHPGLYFGQDHDIKGHAGEEPI